MVTKISNIFYKNSYRGTKLFLLEVLHQFMTKVYQNIKLKFQNDVAIIELDRPEKKNALSLKMIDEIVDATREAETRQGISCIIIESRLTNPSIFCSGIDLIELATLMQEMETSELPSFINSLQNKFLELRNCQLPTIAAINGLCLGAGIELAIACDFRVATPRSTFSLKEVKYGIIPDLGGITFLSRLIGLQNTKRMVLLAEEIDGVTGKKIGLIDWLGDDISVLIDNVLNQIQSNSQGAIQKAKQLVNSTLDLTITSSLGEDMKAQLELLSTGEPQNLLRAFHKK